MARRSVIHYRDIDSPSVLCGSGSASTIQWTQNPDAVTCQRCLRSFATRPWRRTRAQDRWEQMDASDISASTEPMDEDDDGLTDTERNDWMTRLGIGR